MSQKETIEAHPIFRKKKQEAAATGISRADRANKCAILR